MLQHFIITAISLFVCFGMFAAEKLTVGNYSFSSKTMPNERNSDGNADPGFKKLTDGVILRDGMTGTGGKSVVWRHILNQEKPVDIRFNFPLPVKIDTVKIHYFRGKRSYGIKAIKLVAVDGERRTPLGGVTLNHPYEKPESDPFYSTAEIKADSTRAVTAVELIFLRAGGYMSLHEIEFFGTVQKLPKASPATVHPAAKKLVEQAAPGLRLFREGRMYVLENDFSIYVVDPRYSGSVNFAYDKIGKRNMALYANPGEGFGPMFSDRFYPGGIPMRDMYRYIPYEVEVVADTPEKKQLRVTGYGRSGIFRNVKIEKLYTLGAGSSVLKNDFSITNGLDNAAPLSYGYWMLGGVQSPEGYTLLTPGVLGVERSPWMRQLATCDLSAGWLGAMSGDHGLAVTAPYELLKEVYFWGDNLYRGTMEFKLGIYPIKAGDSLRFTSFMIPFSGVGTPDKVTEHAALSFGNPPENPTLKFRFFQPGNDTVRLSGGFLKNGKVQFIPLLEKNLNQEVFAEIPYSLPPGNGTCVLRAELLKNGRAVLSAERSCVVGKSSGTWRLTPDGTRRPDLADQKGRMNLDFHSTAVETPHVKWGKPYAGGRPKVLAVNTMLGGIREMVELAQRFDMELTTNYVAGLWSLSGYVMSLNFQSCINELAEKLKKRYDVIVVSGDVWEIFPQSVADTILRQVAEGTGLIVVAPDRYPKELQTLFRPASGNRKIKGAWKKNAEHPVISGIPLETFPETRAFRYTLNGGTVPVTVGNDPLLAEFHYGKGRIFLASYAVEPPRPRTKTRDSRPSVFFLPLMSFDDPGVDHHYWEYQMALWGKMIYEAANRPSGITVENFAVRDGKLVMTLQAKQPETAEISVTLRDKFSSVVDTVKRKVELKSGTGQISVPLPETTLDGVHFAETILSTGRGKAWWGCASFRNRAAGRIVSVKVPERIFRQDESLPVEIDADGASEIVSRLIDNHGNEFARGEGGKLALPLADCLTPACRLKVEARKDGKVIDRAEKRIYLFRKPDRRIFQIAQGWPFITQKAPLYLIDKYIKLLKEYGITCSSGSAPSWDVAPVEKAFRENDVLFISSDSPCSVGGKYPFDQKLKSDSKFDLVRTPCLSDPEVLNRIRELGGQVGGGAFKYGTILVAGADEANMFSNWDGCFSPHCMREFRLWLKRQYRTLDALNRSWKSSFSSWDQVVPMTAPEARKAGSFAAWVDHRSFNDRQRANAFAAQTAGIAGVDPELALSLSGTSETNPWNAWDYYQIMPLMKAIAGYGGEQTIQHRSFATGKLLSMPWIGYDIGYDEHNMKILGFLMDGATGLNIYGGNFYLAPDYTIPPLGRELQSALRRYLGGRAEAVMNFNAFSYPVAFHYSPASIKVDWIGNLDEARKSATAGFKTIVGDGALNYDYLAYGEMEKGNFGKHRILFLPLSLALSDREIAGIDRFVRDGGIVIADAGAGHFDQHGAEAPDRKALLRIFGLESFGKLTGAPALLTGVEKTPFAGMKMNVNLFEAGVRPGTAEVMGRINGHSGSHAGLFLHRYGKGLAIYLGASLPGAIGDQAEMRYNGANRENTRIVNDFFETLFSRAGIVPVVTAPTLRGSELRLREQNGAYLLGVLRDIGQTVNLDSQSGKHTLKLDRNFHVWDLLESKYIGYGTQFDHLFAPTSQNIFVLLPYKPQALDAKISGSGRDFTVNFSIRAQTGRFAEHILRLELTAPDGKVNPSYSRLLFTSGGKGEWKIVLPLNAPEKGWKFKATDVLTGISTGEELGSVSGEQKKTMEERGYDHSGK